MDKDMTIKGLIEAVTVLEAHVPKRFWGLSMEALHEAIERIRINGDKPRVLGLHEAQGADYCFIESILNPGFVRICDVVMTSSKINCADCTEIQVIGCGGGSLMLDHEYGVKWRCWDKEPDYEQMMQTEWDKQRPAEKKYPTWAEWLHRQGILDVIRHHTYSGPINGYAESTVECTITSKVYAQIPAEIAEPLGLERM